MTKCVFGQHILESERLNVRNSTTSAILWCSVHFTIYVYLYLYLTRCFSAVAELLVTFIANARHTAWKQLKPLIRKGLSTPGNKVAENGNKLLPETATLTGAATMLKRQFVADNLLPGVDRP